MRRVLRQDPDVILIGEMRDEETVRTALSAAETGHLVLSTVHTLDATETINRIIDFFPPHLQHQARVMLASTLKGAIAQRLVPDITGEGRVPASEILVVTGRVQDLILNPEETGKITEVIAEGEYYGMRTFDQSLLGYVMEGKVSEEVALDYASSPHDFKLMLAAGGQRASGIEQLAAARPSRRRADGSVVQPSVELVGLDRDSRSRSQASISQRWLPSADSAAASACWRRSESGMALPTALFAMIASFALASAAVLSSVDVQQGSAPRPATRRTRSPPPTPAPAWPCCGSTGSRTASADDQAVRRARRRTADRTDRRLVSRDRGRNGRRRDLLLPDQRLQHEGAELSVVAVGTAGEVSRRVEVGLISDRREKRLRQRAS